MPTVETSGTCLLALLLAWLECLAAPFLAFTFTDALDFIFPALILFSLGGLWLRHRRRPYPRGWIRGAINATWMLAILAPMVPLAGLYLLSWRASLLIGHWPHRMINDPKLIGANDALYQSLMNAIAYSFAFSGWALYSLGALVVHLRDHLSVKAGLGLLAVFAFGWIFFACEPSGRYLWWLD